MAETHPSRQALLDAIVIWRAVPHTGPAALIEAATQCLVDDLDGPNLRLLAGTSVVESQFAIEGLVEGVTEELSLGEALSGDPYLGAVTVLARRFVTGEIDAHQLGRWAHRNIGHEGARVAQPFVNLDDVLDEPGLTARDEAEIAAAARAEAIAFLAGAPSPKLL